MRKTLISAAVVALVYGPLATAAFAAGPAQTAAAPAATAAAATPKQSSLQWPVCDKSHTDHCIELGRYKRLDRETNRAYPHCATIKSRTAKASCIETAFKSKVQKHT